MIFGNNRKSEGDDQMEKIIDIFEKLYMIIAAGIALLVSFILDRTGFSWGAWLSWIPVVICGTPIVYSAIKKLIVNKGIKKSSSSLLITIAMIAAICIGDLFAAAEVAFIMAIGEMLEDVTTGRARKGIDNLIKLKPAEGRLIRDGAELMIPQEKICPGDVLRVYAGEAIPVDGEVVSGETTVDQSIVTGESAPIEKKAGDQVFCGTLNRHGVIDIRATNVGEDSSLEKLVKLVENSEKNPAQTERVVDRWASYLVPVSFAIAVITLIVTRDIERAVTVLVVFCPCALVLATPTAIMAAVANASRNGVMIKSALALEKFANIEKVAFDKTGTLTCGMGRVPEQTREALDAAQESGWSDALRDEVPEVVSELRNMGVKTVMLSGDEKSRAKAVADAAGIDDFYAELLPEDKLRIVKEMCGNSSVCMVGDGVNDAPALKTADVGIAMGALGTDIAVEAADIALMTDDLTRLPYLRWLSKATIRTIHIAISISMGINFAAIICSVLGLLGPTLGAIVHNAGSIFVILLAASFAARKR